MKGERQMTEEELLEIERTFAAPFDARDAVRAVKDLTSEVRRLNARVVELTESQSYAEGALVKMKQDRAVAQLAFKNFLGI